MEPAHKYFQDKLVLLLLTVNSFLFCVVIALVVLRLNTGASENFIVQYRANVGVGSFQTGSITDILLFIVFALITLAISIVFSVKTYSIKRQLSVTLLGMGMLLLIITIIVSNALLALR